MPDKHRPLSKENVSESPHDLSDFFERSESILLNRRLPRKIERREDCVEFADSGRDDLLATIEDPNSEVILRDSVAWPAQEAARLVIVLSPLAARMVAKLSVSVLSLLCFE